MIQQKYDLTEIDTNKYPCIKTYHEEIKHIISKIIEKKYDEVNNKIENAQLMCDELKRNAVRNKDEKTANISFLLKQYLLLLKSISSFWKLCDNLDYQDAWSLLQDGLDYLRTLQKFMLDERQLLVKEINNYLENIEKLYPYVYFNSIEVLNKKKICSICNRSPFDPECSHIAGNLYMGEMATIIVKEVEFLGVSLVKNPADKRCIILMNYDKKDIENSPFRLIHTLITNLQKPFHFFELKLTKRKLPRQFYASWSKDSFCPCGSEKPFKECCSDKEFIDNPHYQIISKGILKI